MADKTVTVEQIGSPIRRQADQRATLIGLGLNKMRKRSTLKDTPEVRGMIAMVRAPPGCTPCVHARAYVPLGDRSSTSREADCRA